MIDKDIEQIVKKCTGFAEKSSFDDKRLKDLISYCIEIYKQGYYHLDEAFKIAKRWVRGEQTEEEVREGVLWERKCR